MAATLLHIAKDTGLSVQTVSECLNTRGGRRALFRPETRERVREAAKRLGYIPNGAARATATGHFNTVAFLQSTVAVNSMLPGLRLDAVCDALAEEQMHLVISKIPDAKLTDETYVPQMLRELVCDGLLVNYQWRVPPHLGDLMERYRLPAFWINSKRAANCVFPDEQAAAYQATRRLLDLGHRRITFALIGGFNHFSSIDRFAGCKQAMTEAGLEIKLAQFEVPSIRHVMPQLGPVLTQPDAPTAVIGYTPAITLAYYRAALQAGLRVPRDLSLIAFHSEPAVEVDASLATVLIPERAMGSAAVAGLLKLIEDPTLKLEPLALASSFVEGETLGDPR